MSESVTQGRLDLALLNSLQIDPRASWARVGSALNISPGAAARRWERLARSGTAWVTAHPGPHFGTAHCFAFVAVRCEPGRKVEVADTLAGDPHAVSVEITAGGADLFLTVATTDLNAFGRYLLERVDRLPGVTATESSLVSQMFGEGGQWRLGVLDAEQKAALRSAGTPDAVPHHRPLTELEQRLFLGLCEDGRTSHEGLADLVGTKPGDRAAEAARAVQRCRSSRCALRRRVHPRRIARDSEPAGARPTAPATASGSHARAGAAGSDVRGRDG